MSSLDGVSIREMTVADVPDGLRFCRASGWNQTRQDWQFFLDTAPHGAFVACEYGGVIGTVTTLPYGPFTWIAMVLVDPSARGRGIGTLLLNRGLSLVGDRATARLDATPAGEVLYRSLGFVGEYRLARVFLDAGPRRRVTHAPGARLIRPADWPAILRNDAIAFGASRASLLERLARDAPEYAWVLEREGRLCGHLLGRHGHVRDHLGPMVADDVASARTLLDTCLAAHPDRTFFLDVPDHQAAWRDELGRLGFQIERPFLRMHRGTLASPGQPSDVFAITGAEFG